MAKFFKKLSKTKGELFPDRIVTYHQLAYYLLREAMAKEVIEYTMEGKFTYAYQRAISDNTTIEDGARALGRSIVANNLDICVFPHKRRISSKYKQYLAFIIFKHIEAEIIKAKNG